MSSPQSSCGLSPRLPGEPGYGDLTGCPISTWVYPRACGGTRLIARVDQLPSGLSRACGGTT